jgi:PAS domain S-box-containing protein
VAKPDYEVLVEGLGDMIYTIDLAGRFSYMNAAGLSVLDYTAAELLGKRFTEVLTPDSARVALEHFERGISGTEVTPFFDVQAIRSDGEIIDIEIRAGSLHRDGELVGRQGVGRDISAIKRLQAEVESKSQRLALLEAQARTAMDLYRRIAEMTLLAPNDPEAAGRALRSLEDSVSCVAAEQLGLSKTDLQIVELLAAGLSNPEIAAEVHLSRHTVKDRVAKLMNVFGARSRTEVVANAALRGLLGTQSAHASDQRFRGSSGRPVA